MFLFVRKTNKQKNKYENKRAEVGQHGRVMVGNDGKRRQLSGRRAEAQTRDGISRGVTSMLGQGEGTIKQTEGVNEGDTKQTDLFFLFWF